MVEDPPCPAQLLSLFFRLDDSGASRIIVRGRGIRHLGPHSHIRLDPAILEANDKARTDADCIRMQSFHTEGVKLDVVVINLDDPDCQ